MAVYGQGELAAPGALPLAVRPDEQGEKLRQAQIAALALQLLGKPVAIVLAGAVTRRRRDAVIIAVSLLSRAGKAANRKC